MKIFDVIKYEGNNDVLVWKFPGEDFNTLSQLIVHESQEAIFLKNGQALDLFRAGRYTLHSQNIPLIRKFVNLPFNGESPFHCEVFFVNKVVSMDVRWKTESAIPIQDPIYKIILPIMANGQFAVQVDDSKKFLFEMVGQLKQFDQKTLMNYFRGILMTNIKDYIVKEFNAKHLSFLEIQGNLKKISDGIGELVVQEFEKYGLRLVNFNVTDIAPVENDSSYLALKKALEKRAEMQVLGYNYQQERTYDILDAAASNEGTPSEFIGAGLGMSMGMNIGNTVGNFMGGTISSMQEQSAVPNMQEQPTVPNQQNQPADLNKKEAQTEKKEADKQPERICQNCNSILPENARFCPTCGAEQQQDTDNMICPHCGERVPKGKFCIACGKNMQNVCSKCGATVSEEMKYCMSCGEKIK